MKFILIFVTFIFGNITTLSQEYWDLVNTPSNFWIRSFSINSSNNLFIGVQNGYYNGGVYRSIDFGNAWEYVGLEGTVLDMYINNLDSIYAGSAFLYFSDNNAISWDTISEEIFLRTIFTKNNLILVGTWGGIFRSDNHGENWQKVMSCSQNFEIIMDFVFDKNSGNFFAGSTNYYEGGGIYQSTDDGNTWEIFGLSNHFVSSLSMNSNGDLLAGTRGHAIYGTGGVFMLPFGEDEWITLNDVEIVTAMTVNEQDNIYIGCSIIDSYSGGIRRSIDNGQTWENISFEVGDTEIEGLKLNIEGYLFVLTHYSPNLLYKTVTSTITSIPELLTNSEIETYNYPNPFSSATTIFVSYPGQRIGIRKISIFNGIGELVKIVSPSNLENTQAIQIILENASNGIYYYKIDFGDTFILDKMIYLSN